jgi:hypothetical protein
VELISGHDLEIRAPDGIGREALAMRLSGLAYDLLSQVSEAPAPPTPAPTEKPRKKTRKKAKKKTRKKAKKKTKKAKAGACPTCDASGRQPCRDTRRGRNNRAMNKHHADRP